MSYKHFALWTLNLQDHYGFLALALMISFRIAGKLTQSFALTGLSVRNFTETCVYKYY